MICTKCGMLIESKKGGYFRTKRGSHHFECGIKNIPDLKPDWTPGIPPEPGTYAVRTVGAKMLPTCMEIDKAGGDWGTLEWVRLPE